MVGNVTTNTVITRFLAETKGIDKALGSIGTVNKRVAEAIDYSNNLARIGGKEIAGRLKAEGAEITKNNALMAAADKQKAINDAIINKQTQLKDIMAASGLEVNRVSRGLQVMGYAADKTGNVS